MQNLKNWLWKEVECKREKVWYVPFPTVPFRAVQLKERVAFGLKMVKIIYRDIDGKCQIDWVPESEVEGGRE